MRTAHFRGGIALATLALSLARPALAQEVGAQEADADQASGEIIVTAQKRAESLQDVPVAVAALSGDTLARSGTITMQGVAKLVPSLTVYETDSPISQSYRIRGVGSQADIPTFEPDVGLFIDGVYLPRSGLGVDDLLDIERIEVLNGPQSTLYGKNVTGGVVNVVTSSPSREFEGHFTGSLSNIEGGRDALTYRLAGSLSGPLGDDVRARLTGVWFDQGPTVRNLSPGAPDVNNLRRYAVRGQIEFDLSETTQLRVAAARSELRPSRASHADIFYGSTAVFLDDVLGGAFGLAACPSNDPNDRTICSDAPYQTSSVNNLVSATLTTEVGTSSLTAISGWSDYSAKIFADDSDQLVLPIASFRDVQKGSTFTQELRLASPAGGKVEWLVGGYYLRSSFERGDRGRTAAFTLQPAAAYIPLDETILPPEVVLGQDGDRGFLDSRAKSEYWAAFWQATLALTDQLSLSGGLRWQTETKTASINNTSLTEPNPALIGTGLEDINLITAVLSSPIANGSYRRRSSDLTWSATARYKPGENATFYATYSRGGKSGGFNIGFGNSPASARPFNDETVDSYEAGAKFTLADRKLRMEFAGFHTVYRDFQDAGFVGLQFLVNNAEKVVIDGFEGHVSYRPTSGLTLDGALTWLDPRHDTYTNGSCYPGRAPDSAFDPAIGGFTACNLSGATLPLTPKWKTSASVQYEHETGFGALYGRIDWSWSSRFSTNTNLDPRHVQGAHSLFNLRLGARLGGGFDASIWSNNLFNRNVILVDGVHNLLADESFQRFLAPPREIGVTLRKEF